MGGNDWIIKIPGIHNDSSSCQLRHLMKYSWDYNFFSAARLIPNEKRMLSKNENWEFPTAMSTRPQCAALCKSTSAYIILWALWAYMKAERWEVDNNTKNPTTIYQSSETQKKSTADAKCLDFSLSPSSSSSSSCAPFLGGKRRMKTTHKIAMSTCVGLRATTPLPHIRPTRHENEHFFLCWAAVPKKL